MDIMLCYIHCAPLEREIGTYSHSIDISLLWSENGFCDTFGALVGQDAQPTIVSSNSDYTTLWCIRRRLSSRSL